jgi:hypothetical protein
MHLKHYAIYIENGIMLIKESVCDTIVFSDIGVTPMFRTGSMVCSTTEAK